MPEQITSEIVSPDVLYAGRSFRFAGKDYAPGDPFPYRRLAIAPRKLQQLRNQRYLAEVPPAPAAAPQITAPKIKISAAARKIARQHGIDLAAINGTGKDGAITVADVRAAYQESRNAA